ncbi:hypothetical protein TNCV_1767011 [Trichonephila clavipes]|nr:hypothetical protein TNCV_1767011 [Trichonephila clavipes]
MPSLSSVYDKDKSFHAFQIKSLPIEKYPHSLIQELGEFLIRFKPELSVNAPCWREISAFKFRNKIVAGIKSRLVGKFFPTSITTDWLILELIDDLSPRLR